MLKYFINNLLLMLIFLTFSSESFSQEKIWSEKQVKLLEQHKLSVNDHRGILFINDYCSNKDDPRVLNPDFTAKNEKEGINLFLYSTTKKDLTIIFIKDFIDPSLCGNLLNIWKISKIYLK